MNKKKFSFILISILVLNLSSVGLCQVVIDDETFKDGITTSDKIYFFDKEHNIINPESVTEEKIRDKEDTVDIREIDITKYEGYNLIRIVFNSGIADNDTYNLIFCEQQDWNYTLGSDPDNIPYFCKVSLTTKGLNSVKGTKDIESIEVSSRSFTINTTEFSFSKNTHFAVVLELPENEENVAYLMDFYPDGIEGVLELDLFIVGLIVIGILSVILVTTIFIISRRRAKNPKEDKIIRKRTKDN